MGSGTRCGSSGCTLLLGWGGGEAAWPGRKSTGWSFCPRAGQVSSFFSLLIQMPASAVVVMSGDNPRAVIRVVRAPAHLLSGREEVYQKTYVHAKRCM